MKDSLKSNSADEEAVEKCPRKVWNVIILSFLTLLPKILAGFLFLIVPPIEGWFIPPAAALLILCESGSLILLSAFVLGGQNWARRLFVLVAAVAVFAWLVLGISDGYSTGGIVIPVGLSGWLLLAAVIGLNGEEAQQYFHE